MAPPAVTKDLQVPKRLHGKIIGRKAATIRDIESDYPGVKVTVPRRNDPSELVRLEGPADAVRRAEHRVRDIAGLVADEAAHERAKAEGLRREKDVLFSRAQRTRDPQKRHQLLDEAHAKKRAFEAEEAEAAKRIFRTRNSGYGLEQIDLHGLHLDEALEQVRDRLCRLEAGEVRGHTVEIITGAGHHSEHHRAKLRPAVEELLKQKRQTLSYGATQGGGGFQVYRVEGSRTTSTSGTGEIEVELQGQGPRGRGGLAGFLSMVVAFFCCGGKGQRR